ncbi:MAG: DUF2892 domain-containing protein [Hyphomonadaceae bacterium]|nr:DUF2892 domain-containing protein [Clostridia bacterium]
MKNVGTIDKIIRIIMGLALLSMLLFVDNNNKYWGLIGLMPIITASIGFCPLYAIFGIRTCPLKIKK